MVQYALIVAGGKGLRMGCDLPKQFLPIGGKPVLMRTIEAFYAYNAEIRIILVLPYSQQSYWNELCRKHHFSIPHHIANGGETRFHSVKNGLAFVTTPGLVGVHDGVRPFVAREVIARCYSLAAEKQAVVPVTDVVPMMCVQSSLMSVISQPSNVHPLRTGALTVNVLLYFAEDGWLAFSSHVPPHRSYAISYSSGL